MKTKSIVKIVLWSIVAFILTGVLLCVLFAQSIFNAIDFSFDLPFGFSYANADKYSVGGAEIDAEGITDIEINWTDGKVLFYGEDTDKISFSENYEGEDKNKVHYLVENNKLIIQYCESKSIFKWINVADDKELKITLPKNIDYNKVEISVVSAEADVKDIITDNLNIDGVSGVVTLSGITSDTVNINTVSGNVKATDITAEKKIEFDGVSAKGYFSGSIATIEADSTSGDLIIESTICPQSIEFDTVSGDCEIFIPDNDGFTTEYDTVSGSLNNDFPIVTSGDKYIYGNGKAKFEFDSSSGDVKIKRNTGLVLGQS